MIETSFLSRFSKSQSDRSVIVRWLYCDRNVDQNSKTTGINQFIDRPVPYSGSMAMAGSSDQILLLQLCEY